MKIRDKFKQWFKRFFRKRPKLLLPKEFWRIRKELYHEKNDCSNKCGDYADCLVRDGLKPIFVIIKLRNTLHAVVKCNGFYYDPTFGKWGYCDEFGEYRFSVRYEDRDKWGTEFMDYVEKVKRAEVELREFS